MTHALRAAGVQAIFCGQAGHAFALGFDERIPFDGVLGLYESATDAVPVALEGVQKVKPGIPVRTVPWKQQTASQPAAPQAEQKTPAK